MMKQVKKGEKKKKTDNTENYTFIKGMYAIL